MITKNPLESQKGQVYSSTAVVFLPPGKISGFPRFSLVPPPPS